MLHILAFCAFVVATALCAIKKDYAQAFGWCGLALLNLP